MNKEELQKKASDFRKHKGKTNFPASRFAYESMYGADEVVRLMTDFADLQTSELKAEIERLKDELLAYKQEFGI